MQIFVVTHMRNLSTCHIMVSSYKCLNHNGEPIYQIIYSHLLCFIHNNLCEMYVTIISYTSISRALSAAGAERKKNRTQCRMYSLVRVQYI